MKFLASFRKWYVRRAKRLRTEGIFPSFRNSKGYVLIMVLILSTLLTGLAVDLIVSSRTSIAYYRAFDNRLNARFLARSGLVISRAMLDADRRGLTAESLTGVKNNPSIDSYQDIWAVDFPPIPLDEGSIHLSIEDENTKINLSVLANEFVNPTPYYGIFQRLLQQLDLPMDIADAVIDWVDPDKVSYSYGAETADHYSALTPSYGAKNDEMDSVRELLMVKGITPRILFGLYPEDEQFTGERYVEHNRGEHTLSEETLDELMRGEMPQQEEEITWQEPPVGPERSRALIDYVRVHGVRSDFLREENRININTASFRVLSALTEDMTADRVTELIRRRQKQPFTSVDEVSDLIEDETVRKNLLSVSSSVFKITVTAYHNNDSARIVAVYDRKRRSYLYYYSD
jgi:type II secretory pathway component PulK